MHSALVTVGLRGREGGSKINKVEEEPSFPHSPGAHRPDQQLRGQRRGWDGRKRVGVSLGRQLQEARGQGGARMGAGAPPTG